MSRRLRLGALALAALIAVPVVALVIAVRGPANPAQLAPLRPVLIAGVSVFEPGTGSLAGPVDVVLRDGRIAGLWPAGEAPPEALAGDLLRLDGAGQTLLPGLIDVHVHLHGGTQAPTGLSFPEARHHPGALLLAGVTTVQDTGGPAGDLRVMAEDVASGALVGPEITFAGPPLTVEGGHPLAIFQAVLPAVLHAWVASHMALPVDGPGAADQAVATVVEAGASVIKVMLDDIPVDGPELDDATLVAIVTAAHQRGRPVVAHVGTDDDARRAAIAGVDALVHMPYRDRVTPETARLLADRQIPVATTLQIWTRLSELLAQRIELTGTERAVAPPRSLANLLAVLPTLTADDLPAPLRSWLGAVQAGQPLLADNVRTLVAHGVVILAGSDSPNVGAYPGGALHRELDLLVAAGLTPAAALRAATLANATFLGMDDRVGRVRAGYEADLLLVRGDPTADIAAVHAIVAVFTNGRLVERAR